MRMSLVATGSLFRVSTLPTTVAALPCCRLVAVRGFLFVLLQQLRVAAMAAAGGGAGCSDAELAAAAAAAAAAGPSFSQASGTQVGRRGGAAGSLQMLRRAIACHFAPSTADAPCATYSVPYGNWQKTASPCAFYDRAHGMSPAPPNSYPRSPPSARCRR